MMSEQCRHIISDLQGNNNVDVIFKRLKPLAFAQHDKGLATTVTSNTASAFLAAVTTTGDSAGDDWIDEELSAGQRAAVNFVKKREEQPFSDRSYVYMPFVGKVPPEWPGKRDGVFFDRFSKETRAGKPEDHFGATVAM